MHQLLALLALLGLGLASEHDVFRVKQNYDEKVNSLLVQQIQYELKASYMYQAYGHFFARSDVALPGFAKWFEKASLEEREHATKLIEYINRRGGTVSLSDLDFGNMCKTVSDELAQMTEFSRNKACICYFMSHKKDAGCEDRRTWKNALWAMQDTLVLERYVNQLLLDLHRSADSATDPHLTDFLESHYLDEQVESIKEVSHYIRQLERVGDGLGEYIFDKDISS